MSTTIQLGRETEINRVQSQLQRARQAGNPATLTITIEEWVQTIALFNGLCASCRVQPFDDLDHLYPITKGGGTTQMNCAPACAACNSYKNDRVDGSTLTGEPLQEAISRIHQWVLTEGGSTFSEVVFVDDYAHMRVLRRTQKNVRVAAALAEKSGIELLDELVTKELERLQRERRSHA